MATPSNILAWKSHGQSSLVGYSTWGCKGSVMTSTSTDFEFHRLTLPLSYEIYFFSSPNTEASTTNMYEVPSLVQTQN